jgi:hypothetical protein
MSRRADILAECIDALFRGAEPEEVLRRYPKDASDIAPLVETARRLRSTRPDFEALDESEVVRRLLRTPVLPERPSEADRASTLGAVVLALSMAVLFQLYSGAIAAVAVAAMVVWLICWLGLSGLTRDDRGAYCASPPSSGR